MKLISLYLENFMCYESTQLDLSSFNCAVIVGIQDNNDNISNGTGKSTLFKAIEYVLFNKARNLNLEKIIRDDTNKCKVGLDFKINDKIYRIIRSRTIKGSSDLSLFERTSYETDLNFHSFNLPEDQFKLFWNDISGRRINDTEAVLQKLHKITFEAFNATNHFIQNDFSGLGSFTTSKRKKMLKECLNLNHYAKLEKLSNEELKNISKEIERKKIILNNIGDPQNDIPNIKIKLNQLEDNLINIQSNIKLKNTELENINSFINDLTVKFSTLNSNNAAFVKKQQELKISTAKIESNIADLNNKIKNIYKEGAELVIEQKSLKEQEKTLSLCDFSKLSSLNEELISLKENNIKISANISIIKNELVELKIPFPDDANCKHCRQPLTLEHREECKKQIKKEIDIKEKLLQEYQNNLTINKNNIVKLDSEINNLNISKNKLSVLADKIINKSSEIKNKKKLYEEYSTLLSNLREDLKKSQEELNNCQIEIDNSNKEELDNLSIDINSNKNNYKYLKKEIDDLTNNVKSLFSEKVVLENLLKEKENNIIEKESLNKDLSILMEEISIYYDLVEAFSSNGIPNLLLQNILDDFQIEANRILSQLKSGLQLSFSVQKTNSDGEIEDDLDIVYHYNNKNRDAGQLSGAMSIAVLFAIKMGFTFLLQKMLGAQINFILIDEIDMPFDKSGTDALYDILKFFQKDFDIFIITHSDRLKDKFSQGILVEQDKNMISKASTVVF